jgi:hypothetical protein
MSHEHAMRKKQSLAQLEKLAHLENTVSDTNKFFVFLVNLADILVKHI